MSSLVRRRRKVVTAGVIAALIVAGWLVYLSIPPTHLHSIRPSYAFDVSDRRQVAGFVDYVIVGQIAGDGSTSQRDDGPPRTTYSVRVQQNLKGKLGAGVISIRQTRGKIGNNVWVVEGGEPLLSGKSYVLALTKDRGGLTLLCGPRSPTLLSTDNERSLLADWQDAIRHQRWPENLPR